MATLESIAAQALPRRFRIRLLREPDLQRVMEIEQECFSTPWKEATFRGLMKRSDTDLLVAEAADGWIAGYAACWTVIDQSELGNVAVAAAARGMGVGGALVDAVVERIKDRGAMECYLEVRESNEAAQSLYRQRGFVVVGRRPRYYSLPTEDALVMRLRVGELSS
jgi:ribosomal-protein-alanine N-acetyltransferase